ncbi:hypothetical protein GHK52_03320 [Lactococcus garvieae]|nr:hypothetical protein [Lactococcus garvieae]
MKKQSKLEEQLQNKIWSFGKVNNTPFTESLRLNEDGTIGGYRTEYEVGWELKDETLYFLDAQGEQTAAFSLEETDFLQLRGQSLKFKKVKFELKISQKTDLYDSLTSSVYKFAKVKQEVFSQEFSFNKDFTIGGYSDDNETYWEIQGEEIWLFGKNYELTSIFQIIDGNPTYMGGESTKFPGVYFELILLKSTTKLSNFRTVEHLENETAFRIQNIIMPEGENKKGDKREIYYLEDTAIVSDGVTYVDGLTDFTTYLNMVSVNKWLTYTQAKQIYLKLEVKGDFDLHIVENSLRSHIEEIRKLGFRKAFDDIQASPIDDLFRRNAMNHQSTQTDVIQRIKSYSVQSEQKKTLLIPVEADSTDNMMVGFQIEGQAQVFDVAWYATVEKSAIRDVKIALNTTTFQKEEYVLNNLDNIRNNIFEATSEEAGLNQLGEGHLFVNVVDNGQSLAAAEVESQYVSLFANPNVGGAGGFTRGMIETLNHQKMGRFAATHILFMDDDIEVLPESFKRTFALLSIVKTEYQDHFISGAMLDSLDGITQYEDTGFLSSNQDVVNFPTKDRYDLTELKDILRNNLTYPVENQYAAWWYAVVPLKFIDDKSMSLPIFYRGDDIEFSIRNKAQIMTMNGLAVWHLPFYTKKSKALDGYLGLRNILIDQSVNGFVPDVDYLEKYIELYKKELRMFNYGAADQVLDALEDYLKGPEYIAGLDGISTIRRVSAKNEVLSKDIPEEIKARTDTADEYWWLSPQDIRVFIDSDNGHGLPDWSFNMFDDDLKHVPIINQEMLENPGKQFMRKRLAVYDTYDKTYVMRERNQELYEQVEVRREALLKDFEARGAEVAADYHAHAEKFHSKEFWVEYLDLEE